VTGPSGPAASFTSDIAAATAGTTTTSASDVLVAGATLTPAAGTYLVWFTGSHSQSNNNDLYTIIYSGGSPVAASERTFNRGATTSATTSFSSTAKVTVNGSQAIEGRWRITGGTATLTQGQLMILKV
jgi:hypothetical protein